MYWDLYNAGELYGPGNFLSIGKKVYRVVDVVGRHTVKVRRYPRLLAEAIMAFNRRFK